ncbi:MAG: ArnT family glycosyltransferase [Candidatus Hodarchaeota archaeon]
MFNYQFLIIALIVTTIPLFLCYFREKNIKQLDQKTKTAQNTLFDHSGIIFVGSIMVLIFLVQIRVIEIPNRALDEYAYIYIARNLAVDNTNFTATPPWLNKERYVPRYVFITLITVFCSFFGFEFESAELLIITSNVMLIPVVFSFASTFYDRNVGSVATALITVNPVFWLLSIRIYPDISVTVFSWASFYFLLKALKNAEQDLIEQKYVILSFLFLILALFTKNTVILLIPAFFLLFFVYTRNQITRRPKNFLSFFVVLLMISLSIIISLVRFGPDVVASIEYFSTKGEGWSLEAIYDTMINPLGPISQFSFLILVGIFLAIKSESVRDKRNLTILVVAWLGYVLFFLIYPHFMPDKRHVFSQQVSATIIAAFGIVSISKHRKLWTISLPVLILAHAIDESLAWKGNRQSSLLIEALFIIIVLIVLVEGIRRTARKKTLTAHSFQTAILLGLTLFAFANAAFLDRYNVTWEEQVRDESRVQAVFFLKNVGNWLKSHEIGNESIMTNAYATLPYYTGFVTVYVPPEIETEFLSCLSQKNLKYLIIFWGTRPFLRHVLGGKIIQDEAPYLERYVWNPPSNARLVYSDKTQTIENKEVGVVIFKIE